MDEIKEVETLLAERLDPENGMVLANQLVAIEAWLGRISKLLADANALLDRMKDKYKLPKSAGLTDLDRTIMLDGAVADFRANRDYLEALQDTIRRRCTLGQSLLRNLRTEMEVGLH